MRHSLLPLAVMIIGLAGCDPAPPDASPRVVQSLLEQRRDKVVIQSWDISCGAAALATLLTYDENDPVTEREVASGLLKFTTIQTVQSQLGFSLLDLKRYSESRGFKADGLGNVTLRDLLDLGPAILPVILHGYNHFVVFRGIQGDRVLLSDPAWGNRTMLMSEFLDIWASRVAFTVGRPEAPPAVHPLQARSKDFWASSAVYQEPEIVTAALAPDPTPTEAVASVAVSPLSVVAAGPAPLTTPHPAVAETVVFANPVVASPIDRPRVSASVQPTARPDPALASSKPGPAVAVRQAVEQTAVAPAVLVAEAPPADPVQAPVEDLQSATASPATGHPLARQAADTMMTRAADMLELGDVSGARRLYTAVAGAGNGAAATAMGHTYDPEFLKNIREIGVLPDLDIAAEWYRQAVRLGDASGLIALDRMKKRDGRDMVSMHQPIQ